MFWDCRQISGLTSTVNRGLVDRQLFPRLLALAERGWSPDNLTEWPAFQRRAREQLPRLAALGIHYQDQDLSERHLR